MAVHKVAALRYTLQQEQCHWQQMHRLLTILPVYELAAFTELFSVL